ncbi:MAG: trehalose-phosphatase [Chloroflexi bacterium]|mgnify:CR=1 FL=1|nr:trehalose-phosphatase [Chloroflexota bacterium]
MHWQTATDTLLRPLIEKPRVGLVTDVDGTISPIVARPDDAQVTPRSRDLLAALHDHLALVAVISGRAAHDVQARVGLAGLVYAGNHGLEWWQDGESAPAPGVMAFRPALEAARRALEPHLLPGMLSEDKGATLSIHYRQAADPADVEARFGPLIERIAGEHRLRVFRGRMVYEIRPPIDINKGSAFHDLITTHQLDAAVYLGDDTTDVDALRMARQMRDAGECFALGLGVESDHMPPAVRENADLLVAGVQDVEAFLAWWLRARMASST